jgi:hypothetical protein
VQARPFEPQDVRGWTVPDLLALAGACPFAAQSHGPALHRVTDLSRLPL